MAILIKTSAEIDKMRRSGEALREVHEAVPVSYTHLDVYKRQLWDSATPGMPWSAPSQAPATVPLPRMKLRLAFSPTLIPLRTASGRAGRRWSMAMLTLSLGVPSTIHVGHPRPRSTRVECTGLWRDLAAPIQLCSAFGAATQTSWPAARSARTSSWRKTDSMPSSFVTRSLTPQDWTGADSASGAFFLASSSCMAALRERRTLPVRSSMPMHLTVIISPILTTSSVRRTRKSASSEI